MTGPHSTDRLVAALLDERDRRIKAEDERDRRIKAEDERDRRIKAEDERDQLRRRVEVLDRKLVELSDPYQDTPALRRAYRTGYGTGYHAGRRRADLPETPEETARGALAHAMRTDLLREERTKEAVPA